MKILTDTQLRLLAFVHCCELGGDNPSKVELEAWLKSPGPKRTTTLLSTIAAMQAALNEGLGTQSESDVAHALKCKWLSSRGEKLYLTPIGRALLRGSEKLADESDESEVVVLDASDSLAYTKLIGTLASYGPALLVDPYLGIDELDQITKGTSIDRVLVSAHSRRNKERALIAAYLTTLDSSRTLQARASSALHDRVIITNSGNVVTLGASLNGIGKKTTILSPVPEPAAATLAKHYMAIWEDAESVQPPAIDEPGSNTNPKK